MNTDAAADSSFVSTAVADIGASLFGAENEPETENLELEGSDDKARSDATSPSQEPDASASPPPAQDAPKRAAPKSWGKDYHEDWAALTPRQQEYIEKREKDFLDGTEGYRADAGFAKQLREVVAPYKAMLQAQGINETQAIQYLLNAQYRLTSGTPEERKAAWSEIGKTVGLIEEAASPNLNEQNPELLALKSKLERVESALTQTQQRELAHARAKADADVNTFAADPAHPYVDEVANDMAPWIERGLSLKDAYEKAVWANPTTRAKELARIQTEADLRKTEKARAEGEAAKRATAVNVRGSESRKAPTEPKGSMEDTIRATFAKIKARH